MQLLRSHVDVARDALPKMSTIAEEKIPQTSLHGKHTMSYIARLENKCGTGAGKLHGGNNTSYSEFRRAERRIHPAKDHLYICHEVVHGR